MSSVQLSEVFRHLKLFIDSLPQEQHNEPLSAATRGFNYDLFKTLTPRCFDLYLEGTSHLKHQLLANFEGVNNSIHNKCKTLSPGDSRITIPNYHQYLRIHNIAQHQTTFRLPTNHQHILNTLRPQPQASTSTSHNTQPPRMPTEVYFIRPQLQPSAQPQQSISPLLQSIVSKPSQDSSNSPPISPTSNSQHQVQEEEEEEIIVEQHQPSCHTDTCLLSSTTSLTGSDPTLSKPTDFNQTTKNKNSSTP